MNSQWPLVPLGKVLNRSQEAIEISPIERYKEATIRLWGKGVVLRGEIDGREIKSARRFRLRTGQFVLSRIDARNGAFGIVPALLEGAAVTNDFPAYIVAASRLLPAYLGWMSKTGWFVDLCRAASEGTTNRVRLQEDRFLQTAVPLPPCAEQCRIVARIEALAAKIDEVRAVHKEVIEDCEVLCRSILFNDPACPAIPTAMSELVLLRVPDVSVAADGTYHFAGVYCFGRGVFAGEQKTGLDFAYRSLTRLRAGDFVYPKLMAWEGALGIVPPECDGLCVSPEYPVFAVNTARVLPEVLDVYFRSPSAWPQLAEISTGTNMRRRRLHPGSFLAFKMPLPPMETQLRLREVKSRLDSLADVQSQSAADLNALLPSILDKAFKGEL